MTDRQKFIDMMLPAAQKYGQHIGVDPRIIVAQAAHETGWGASAPGNNYFGIRSHGESGEEILTTHELMPREFYFQTLLIAGRIPISKPSPVRAGEGCFINYSFSVSKVLPEH